MKYVVTITQEDGEVIEMTEMPIVLRDLIQEAECVARDAVSIIKARLARDES